MCVCKFSSLVLVWSRSTGAQLHSAHANDRNDCVGVRQRVQHGAGHHRYARQYCQQHYDYYYIDNRR